jgi:hypothetical protein
MSTFPVRKFFGIAETTRCGISFATNSATAFANGLLFASEGGVDHADETKGFAVIWLIAQRFLDFLAGDCESDARGLLAVRLERGLGHTLALARGLEVLDP